MAEVDIDAELKTLINATVAETLTSLGIDASDPIAAQSEFAVLREVADLVKDPEHQADLLHLRKWRKSVETAGSVGIKTAIGIVVTGACAALWAGLADFFKP